MADTTTTEGTQKAALEEQQAKRKPPGERAPDAEEAPRTTWVCENSQCRYHGRERTVRDQHLGGGLYLRGTVVCFCGRLPSRVTKR